MWFSWIPVFPGSAEAQVIWGGILKHLLIAYFIGNISSKKYQNLFLCVKVIASHRWDVFWRHGVVRCAQTAEPIRMPFELWTRMGWWKHATQGGGGTWRIRLNCPCAAAMWPYVKLLWPVVIIVNDWFNSNSSLSSAHNHMKFSLWCTYWRCMKQEHSMDCDLFNHCNSWRNFCLSNAANNLHRQLQNLTVTDWCWKLLQAVKCQLLVISWNFTRLTFGPTVSLTVGFDT